MEKLKSALKYVWHKSMMNYNYNLYLGTIAPIKKLQYYQKAYLHQSKIQARM